MQDNDYHFDTAAADRVCDFFSLCLHHSKGEWAGQPFIPAAWQRERILRPLFGMKRADGTRRYRMAYVEVPRKNGKSETAAGIALYLLFSDHEMGAEIYSAAADKEQARVVFKVAVTMIRSSPELFARCKIYRNAIEVPATGGIYRPLSSDVPNKEGLNAHGIIFDELHRQKTRELWDVLTTSVGARRQPLTFAITTAGFNRHTICWEQHDYAEKILNDVILDPTFLPVLYGADPDDDWTSEDVWKKVNPNWGVSVKPEHIREAYKRAKERPLEENTFKRYYLNLWTTQDVRWIRLYDWDACQGETPDLTGMECTAGLDLSTKIDLSAFVLDFPINGKHYVLPFFWVPEDRIAEREKRDRVPYGLWVKQGLIRTTPGNVVDYDFIRRDINEISKRYKIREIAFDSWNATQIANQLMGDGFEMFEFRQGWPSMTAPTKEFEALILGRKIVHDGNAVMRWMVNNVSVDIDPAGNLKPSKKKSTERIDGVVAEIMALGRWLVSPESEKSVYETQGIRTL